jgi:hypothetical protein
LTFWKRFLHCFVSSSYSSPSSPAAFSTRCISAPGSLDGSWCWSWASLSSDFLFSISAPSCLDSSCSDSTNWEVSSVVGLLLAWAYLCSAYNSKKFEEKKIDQHIHYITSGFGNSCC